MRPSSCQAQVVARTGCCQEGVGNRDAREWKSCLLPSKSHLRSPQHCSSSDTTGDLCASGARPPKMCLRMFFLLSPNFSVSPECIELDSSAAHPSTSLATPFPNNKRANNGTLSVYATFCLQAPLFHHAFPPPSSPPISVFTGRSGGSSTVEVVPEPRRV